MKEVKFNINNQNSKNIVGYILYETESEIVHRENIEIPSGGSNEFVVHLMRDLRNSIHSRCSRSVF
jgi:hypothetical protein